MKLTLALASPLAVPAAALLFLPSLAAQDGHNHSGVTSRPQKADKDKIQMDSLSRQTLDRWEKMEYHLGRAGVKTISFTIKVDAKSPLGDAKATGKYTWDGKKGKLVWDNVAFGDMLATRGWSRETLDRLVIGDSHRRGLAGTKLTAKKTDAGEIVISVDGKTKRNLKAFHYDKLGVATKFSMVVSDPMAGEVDAMIRLKYDKIAGKYVLKGWSFDMDLPMSAFHGSVTVTNKMIGRFHVYGTVVEKMTMGDQPFGTSTLTFADYKINGGVVEKTTEKATSKPSSKPTSKPSKSGKKGKPK